MAETDTAPSLDDETTAALTLFNEYVDADRERTRREKRVKKAERAKDEAAAAVRKANESGSAEEKAAAEAAYREAQDAFKKIRDGEEPEEAPAAEAADEAPADGPRGTLPRLFVRRTRKRARVSPGKGISPRFLVRATPAPRHGRRRRRERSDTGGVREDAR